MQQVGDSCLTAGQVCLQFVSVCPDSKKHPGVLYDCGKPDSSLIAPSSVNATTLNLSLKPMETTPIVIRNGGHLPLDLTITQTAGSDAYSTATQAAVIPPKGKYKLDVTFGPVRAASYTGSFEIESDAAIGSPSASIAISGLAKGKLLSVELPTLIKIDRRASADHRQRPCGRDRLPLRQ